MKEKRERESGTDLAYNWDKTLVLLMSVETLDTRLKTKTVPGKLERLVTPCVHFFAHMQNIQTKVRISCILGTGFFSVFLFLLTTHITALPRLAWSIPFSLNDEEWPVLQ